jgi:hypothetical protein
VARNHQAVVGVPAAHHRAAALSHCAWQFTVDPYLGVIINRGIKYDQRTTGIDITDMFRHGDAHAVPVETESTVSSPAVEAVGGNQLPLTVIEVACAGMRRNVLRGNRLTSRLAVHAGGTEFDVADHGIVVEPLCTCERGSFGSSQVDHRQRRIMRHRREFHGLRQLSSRSQQGNSN